MVERAEFEHLHSLSDDDSGHMSELSCPDCGNAVEMIDQRFLRFGPVRCGACGQTLSTSVLDRVLAATIEGGSR